MLEIERAQRSVLKAIFKRPFRFPTSALYSEAKVLTVRQMFIYKIVLLTHSSSKSLACYNSLLSKRIFALPLPRVQSDIGKRFGDYIRVSTYKSVLKQCNLKERSVPEAKILIFNLLQPLTYTETEAILDSTL